MHDLMANGNYLKMPTGHHIFERADALLVAGHGPPLAEKVFPMMAGAWIITADESAARRFKATSFEIAVRELFSVRLRALC